MDVDVEAVLEGRARPDRLLLNHLCRAKVRCRGGGGGLKQGSLERWSTRITGQRYRLSTTRSHLGSDEVERGSPYP